MNFKSKKNILGVLFFCLGFSSFCENYVLAAQKFEYTKGQIENNVTEAVSELIPQEILNNLSTYLSHVVLPDEELDRTLSDLKIKRNSLYLQLNAEYQKRDLIILEKYSQKELDKKLSEENKKIEEIENKIQENLQEVQKAEKIAEEKNLQIAQKGYKKSGEDSTIEKYSSLFKNLFFNTKKLISEEDITLYQSDPQKLYTPSDKVKDFSYDNPIFRKEVTDNKINGLITGKITNYGAYFSVSVSLYSFPGGRLCGTVTELGSANDLEFICSNLAHQITPYITNSMPVRINIALEEDNNLESPEDFQIFIDDVLYQNKENSFIIDSGVHKVQVIKEGYQSATLKYYFEGNQEYDLKVSLLKDVTKEFIITMPKPLPGTIYANGLEGKTLNQYASKFLINGTAVLGEYFDPEGYSDFYYLSEKQLNSDNVFKINPRLVNKSDDIDKRRKIMYGAYSGLILSLIPTFYTNGNKINYINMYNNGIGDYETAVNWNTAWMVCTGISIAAGVFWGYELVRYLISANSVLPQKAKPGAAKVKEDIKPKKENLKTENKELEKVE